MYIGHSSAFRKVVPVVRLKRPEDRAVIEPIPNRTHETAELCSPAC